MIWTLFYYNSLPEMPNGCSFFENDVVYRDFFKCNPVNTGHYQYPKFETLSYDEGCHCREVKNFLRKKDPDKYVILYTRYADLRGRLVNKIVGYFKVGKLIDRPKTGFKASECVLLPEKECIKISYASRGVPVSWGKSKHRGEIEAAFQKLKHSKKIDISGKYQAQTKKIMNRLINIRKFNSMLNSCVICKKDKCFLKQKVVQKKNREKILELYKTERSCS